MRLFYRMIGTCIWLMFCLAASTQQSYGQFVVRFTNVFAGSDKISPCAGGSVTIKVLLNGNTDVTNQFRWVLEGGVVDSCGGPMVYNANFASPWQITLSGTPSNKGLILEGIYKYRFRGQNLTGDIVYTPYAEFIVRSPKNKAPNILTGNLVDTTLEAGVNILPYLEVKGIASDTCTDKVTISWEQLEGPALQNYDSGTGNLILQNAPVGTYLFKIKAEDDRNFEATRTVTVYIRRKELPSITLMKAFSPNEDGVDDLWKVANISVSGNQYSVKIINQHGHMVLHARPPFLDDTVWDGTLYGKPMPEGAYYYIVMDKNNQVVDKGSVVLVR